MLLWPNTGILVYQSTSVSFTRVVWAIGKDYTLFLKLVSCKPVHVNKRWCRWSDSSFLCQIRWLPTADATNQGWKSRQFCWCLYVSITHTQRGRVLINQVYVLIPSWTIYSSTHWVNTRFLNDTPVENNSFSSPPSQQKRIQSIFLSQVQAFIKDNIRDVVSTFKSGNSVAQWKETKQSWRSFVCFCSL